MCVLFSSGNPGLSSFLGCPSLNPPTSLPPPHPIALPLARLSLSPPSLASHPPRCASPSQPLSYPWLPSSLASQLPLASLLPSLCYPWPPPPASQLPLASPSLTSQLPLASPSLASHLPLPPPPPASQLPLAPPPQPLSYPWPPPP